MKFRHEVGIKDILLAVCLASIAEGQTLNNWDARMDDARKRCENGGDLTLVADLENLTSESERFDSSDPRRLSALHTLGSAYHLDGRLVDARRRLESAVETARMAFGEDSIHYAASLIMLAAVNQDLRQTGRSEKLLQQVREILRPRANTYSAHLARADLLLARAFIGRGQIREAEDILKKSLALAPATTVETMTETALQVNLLGMIYLRQERWQEASAAFSHTLELGHALWGGNDSNSAKAAVNLAMARRRLGHPAEAEEIARKAQETLESRLGSDHPSVGAALIERAEALRALKRGREAKPIEARARQILDSYVTGNHLGSTVDFDALSVRAGQ